MLRTNLATRPFYNERVVGLALAALAVVALAFTAFDATRMVVLNGTNSDAAHRIDEAERRAAEARADAARVRAQIDRVELQAVADAAREANLLIDQRTFSWTALFNRFEATLPSDVRIVAVHPHAEKDGRMLVSVQVLSRGVEDLDLFIDRLESTGAFRDVLARQESTTDDGLIESVLEAQYVMNTAGTAPVAAPAGGPKRRAP